MIIGIISLAGGVWVLQDSIASIVFYNTKEKWWWNHVARLIRALWGVAFITMGVIGICQ